MAQVEFAIPYALFTVFNLARQTLEELEYAIVDTLALRQAYE